MKLIFHKTGYSLFEALLDLQYTDFKLIAVLRWKNFENRWINLTQSCLKLGA